MSERTKNDILQAYNRLIPRYHMENITVERIIHEAGISRATFYRHFKDKYDVMNYNCTQLMNYLSDPQVSTDYLDMFEKLFEIAGQQFKNMTNAFQTVGTNSLTAYIHDYSLEIIESITKSSRCGKGFTEAERLECDVFVHGISLMFQNWLLDRYRLTAAEAASALYAVMPPTLKDLWWSEN